MKNFKNYSLTSKQKKAVTGGRMTASIVLDWAFVDSKDNDDESDSISRISIKKRKR